MNGKGDKNRTTNWQQFWNNWDLAFKKPKIKIRGVKKPTIKKEN